MARWRRYCPELLRELVSLPILPDWGTSSIFIQSPCVVVVREGRPRPVPQPVVCPYGTEHNRSSTSIFHDCTRATPSTLSRPSATREGFDKSNWMKLND